MQLLQISLVKLVLFDITVGAFPCKRFDCFHLQSGKQASKDRSSGCEVWAAKKFNVCGCG